MPGLKILRKERAQEMKGKRARIWPAGSQLLLATYNPMLFLGSQVQSGISKVHIPRILPKKPPVFHVKNKEWKGHNFQYLLILWYKRSLGTSRKLPCLRYSHCHLQFCQKQSAKATTQPAAKGRHGLEVPLPEGLLVWQSLTGGELPQLFWSWRKWRGQVVLSKEVQLSTERKGGSLPYKARSRPWAG